MRHDLLPSVGSKSGLQVATGPEVADLSDSRCCSVLQRLHMLLEANSFT